jgi:hypothetical protein
MTAARNSAGPLSDSRKYKTENLTIVLLCAAAENSNETGDFEACSRIIDLIYRLGDVVVDVLEAA